MMPASVSDRRHDLWGRYIRTMTLAGECPIPAGAGSATRLSCSRERKHAGVESGGIYLPV